MNEAGVNSSSGSDYAGKVTGACLACKKAHHACDQDRPQCARCIRLGCECEYVVHRKPGRKRLQSAPLLTQNEEHPAKKRRFFSETDHRDGRHHRFDSYESSPSEADDFYPQNFSTKSHSLPKILPLESRPSESRVASTMNSLAKRADHSSQSSSSQNLFGSFQQSSKPSEGMSSYSFETKAQSFNSQNGSSSSFDDVEMYPPIRRPIPLKLKDDRNFNRYLDEIPEKRSAPSSLSHHLRHPIKPKEANEFHNLVLEGERELMNFKRSANEEGKNILQFLFHFKNRYFSLFRNFVQSSLPIEK